MIIYVNLWIQTAQIQNKYNDLENNSNLKFKSNMTIKN